MPDPSRPVPAPIVRAEGVEKTYDTGAGRVVALRGIDFAVTPGEMVAVMGPSGCGKTTLLNCLSGLDAVDRGAIFLEGADLARMSDRERTDYRARRMGFVFQIYNLLPVLSAVENVELPLLVSGGRPKQARQRALAALAAVGLVDWAGHRPAALSGGQRQRVAVARALVNDPAIVWADEPTGALDSAAAAEVLDLIRLLNRRDGLTVVIVTHDPAIGELCDRIVQMRDGRIVGESGSRGVGASGSQESGDLGSNGVGDGTHRPADPARRHAELVEASRQSPYPSPEILRFAQDDDRGGDAAPRLLDASPSRPRYSPTSRLPDSPTRRQ